MLKKNDWKGQRISAPAGVEFLESRLLLSTSSVAGTMPRAVSDLTGHATGTVYDDVNGDEAHNAGDPVLPGRTVELMPNPYSMTGPTLTTLSDVNGIYHFDGFPPGDYLVQELPPPSWKPSTPPNPNSQVFRAGRTVVTDLGSAPSRPNLYLDQAFGNSGQLSIGNDSFRAVARAPDGRIWIFGNDVIYRLLSNGTLDTTISAVNNPLTGKYSPLFALAQPDGKILVVGRDATSTNHHVNVLRLNADGTLDTAFGSGGHVSVGFTDDIEAVTLSLQPDGKILATASEHIDTPFGTDAIFVRIMPNGTLDNSFGAGGTVILPVDGFQGNVSAAADSNGAIFATLWRVDGVGGSWGEVVKLTPKGAVDTHFGAGGILVVKSIPTGTPMPSDGQNTMLSDLLIQADGKIVVGGTGWDLGTAEQTALAARLNTDGTPDNAFGTNGVSEIPYTRFNQYFTPSSASRVMLAPDGKIVLAGNANASADDRTDFGVARLLPNGMLDAKFGDQGMVTTTFGPLSDNLLYAYVQDDGRIVAIGNSNPEVYSNSIVMDRVNVPDPLSTVSGVVFIDANADGVRQAAESGQGGMTIFADANQNGSLDPGERAAVSDGSGSYLLTGIAKGDYAIRLLLPASIHQTAPTGGLPWTLHIVSGQAIPLVNFGISLPSLISGSGGPYQVTEGATVQLDGTGSTDAAGTIVKFEWDTNYDGNNFIVRATGSTDTFSAGTIDGPASRSVALRVTDNNGLTATSTTTIDIANVPPTARLTGGSVTVGSSGMVTFAGQSDPSPADMAAGFKYSYDFNNDGIFEIIDSAAASAVVPASNLAVVGSHTIRGRIKDKNGGVSDDVTTIVVTGSATGSISGSVYNDANCNAKRDSVEAGLGGRKIFIDKNKNGVLDAGEPTVTTNSAGAYSFTEIAPGSYRVARVLPAGWRSTTPSAGFYDITISSGQKVTVGTFADTQKSLISGLVYKDTNANGKQDAGETGMSGWVVFLDTNNNGKRDAGEASETTSSTGTYSFTNLASGTYHVRQVLPTGWRIANPTGGSYSVTVSSGLKVAARDFADSQKSLISGVIFKDTNSNGKQDAAEVGLAGWVLFLDSNNNGKLDTGEVSTSSDSAGKFNFLVLAGKYNLREVLKNGFKRTSPSAGVYAFTAASGQVVTGKSFGDK